MGHSLERMLGATCIGLALAAGGAALAADSDVIANLGSQPITAGEIKNLLPPLTPAQREQAQTDPHFSSQIVRGTIGRKVLLDEALKQSWDKKPEIASELQRARDEIIIGSYLQSVSLPSSSYPSDAEIRQAYDANRDKFTIAKEYHVAQIFIAEPADAKKDAAATAERKARELGRKAKAKGADFASLARANSEDAVSAQRGGDLGWLAQTQLVPEIRGAVVALGGHGITDPIHVMGGWHIIEVMGVTPPVHPPLDQIRGAIVKLLRDGRANAYVQKQLEDKHLTVNETAAASLFAKK